MTLPGNAAVSAGLSGLVLLLQGRAAVLWDGRRPGAGQLRGAAERRLRQLRRQRRGLALAGGAL